MGWCLSRRFEVQNDLGDEAADELGRHCIFFSRVLISRARNNVRHPREIAMLACPRTSETTWRGVLWVSTTRPQSAGVRMDASVRAAFRASFDNRCEKVFGSDGLPKAVGKISPCSVRSPPAWRRSRVMRACVVITSAWSSGPHSGPGSLFAARHGRRGESRRSDRNRRRCRRWPAHRGLVRSCEAPRIAICFSEINCSW